MSINSNVIYRWGFRILTIINKYFGINIDNPEFNLHVQSTVDPAAICLEGIGIVGINYIGRRSRGTPDAKTAVQTNDTLFQLVGRGWTGTGWSADAGGVTLRAAENWSATAIGTSWRVAVKIPGTTTTQEVCLFKHNTIKFTCAQTYADNAAAVAGGLAAGEMYKTATGEVRIVV